MKITFQVDQLGQLNVDEAEEAPAMPPNPTREVFNALVSRFNNLIRQLEGLPEPRCCSMMYPK